MERLKQTVLKAVGSSESAAVVDARYDEGVKYLEECLRIARELRADMQLMLSHARGMIASSLKLHALGIGLYISHPAGKETIALHSAFKEYNTTQFEGLEKSLEGEVLSPLTELVAKYEATRDKEKTRETAREEFEYYTAKLKALNAEYTTLMSKGLTEKPKSKEKRERNETKLEEKKQLFLAVNAKLSDELHAHWEGRIEALHFILNRATLLEQRFYSSISRVANSVAVVDAIPAMPLAAPSPYRRASITASTLSTGGKPVVVDPIIAILAAGGVMAPAAPTATASSAAAAPAATASSPLSAATAAAMADPYALPSADAEPEATSPDAKRPPAIAPRPRPDVAISRPKSKTVGAPAAPAATTPTSKQDPNVIVIPVELLHSAPPPVTAPRPANALKLASTLTASTPAAALSPRLAPTPPSKPATLSAAAGAGTNPPPLTSAGSGNSKPPPIAQRPNGYTVASPTAAGSGEGEGSPMSPAGARGVSVSIAASSGPAPPQRPARSATMVSAAVVAAASKSPVTSPTNGGSASAPAPPPMPNSKLPPRPNPKPTL